MSDETSERDRILAFAGQVGSPDTPAQATAARRGWLGEGGEVTEAGRELLKSLGEQTGTRTVFRGEM